MGRFWMVSRQSLLAVICLNLSSPSYARSSLSYSTLFERSTCPDPSYAQCTDIGLPADFCCPTTSTCIPLAANTTLLCCPNGANCGTVQPIQCNISLQNITLHPDNTLKTSALGVPLLTCGTGCCPFGYSCLNGNCVQNANQVNSVPGVTTAISSSSTPTSITTSASTTHSATVTPTNGIAFSTSCNKFPALAVIAGFFPGLLTGILLSVASICLLGAHRRKAARRKSGSSFGNISEPVPQSDTRTDFLRKVPITPSTSAGSPGRSNTINRVRSLFRKSSPPPFNSTISDTMWKSSPTQIQHPIAKQPAIPMVQRDPRPVTPVLQREPSYEDINIFADGDTASALRERERQVDAGEGFRNRGRESHQTTFSDMMERSGLAGLQKGQPFVYKDSSSGYAGASRNHSPNGGK